jgi:hypothetical protein
MQQEKTAMAPKVSTHTIQEIHCPCHEKVDDESWASLYQPQPKNV